jgi:hypothetical protein
MSSYPSSDCTNGCLAPGDALYFQFTEPVSVVSLSNVKVELLSAASCDASVGSDVTASAQRTYDSHSQTLWVVPASFSVRPYALRVTLPATITDAAASANALIPLTRCALVDGAAASGAPPAPYLVAGGSAFSPDGDNVSETVSWTARAYAGTIALRIALMRNGRVIRALLLPTEGAADYMMSWDGADGAGRIVDSGVYGYELTALGRAGASSGVTTGYVEVQNAASMLSVWRRQ